MTSRNETQPSQAEFGRYKEHPDARIQEFRLNPFPEAGILADPFPTRVWKISRALNC
jgi:hypothetical protein